jgi:TnpA family transposase
VRRRGLGCAGLDGAGMVDSHGASFVWFGITRLLDFDLIARFKQINTMKLYVPGRGDQYAYPALAPALDPPGYW